MTQRPSVDVVVPFAGSSEALADLVARLERLATAPGDSVVVVDNRAAATGPLPESEAVRVLPARETQSSYYARNRGAEVGEAEWLLFIDADVDPPPDLLDRYFESPAGPKTGVLAGSVVDEPPLNGGRQTLAARYAHLRRLLDQDNTLREGWAYAKTANCAVRREAFAASGGFPVVRSGGDAELCFRLAREGWDLEPRPDASVVHRSRQTIPSLLRQLARHGSGAEWLEQRHPGFSPRRNRGRLALAATTGTVRGGIALLRGDRDRAVVDFVDPLAAFAFELGRSFPNDAAAGTRSKRASAS